MDETAPVPTIPHFARGSIMPLLEPGGVDWCYRQGIHWIRQILQPTLTILAGDTKESVFADVVAHGYSVIADIHEINGAPQAAIRMYRRSIRQASEMSDVGSYSRAELVCQLMRIGDYDGAHRMGQNGGFGRYLPEVELALATEDNRHGPEESRFGQIAEFIAMQHHRKALGLAAAAKGEDRLRARTWCYGSMCRGEPLVRMLKAYGPSLFGRLEKHYLPPYLCAMVDSLEEPSID